MLKNQFKAADQRRSTPINSSFPSAFIGVHRRPNLLQAGSIQAKFASGQPKIYPNLNAAAAIPIDPGEIFSLHNFYDNYRITRGRHHGLLVANSKYIFCRMMSGELLMHPTYRHPAIASGKPVLYAGEAFFDNGKLQWWSNGSGNYRPDAEHAGQAELPMDRFYTYQDILKGRHKDNNNRIIRSNPDSGGNHAKRH